MTANGTLRTARPTSAAALVPAELADTLSSLRVVFDKVGPVLALDVALLEQLVRRHVGAVPNGFEAAVQRAIRLGYLRRIVIGVEPHVLAGESDPPPPPSRDETGEPGERLEVRAPVPTGHAPAKRAHHGAEHARGLEEAAFRLQLAIDAETEKLLLFRVALVLEVIAGLTLARELALWFAGV